MVLIVGQNSVWQNTYNLPSLEHGSVNRVARVFASAAGKGSNVARALAFLGRESLLLAYVGGPNGEKFRRACDEDGIRSDFTMIKRETRICTTLIEDSGTITEVVEPAPAVEPDEVQNHHAAFDRHIRNARLLVISGTAMAGETEECYFDFSERAHRTGAPVLLDSYREHGRRALDASPEILKINADELAELSGMDCETIANRRAAADRIMSKFGVRWIIITRGREGAEAYDGQSSLIAAAPAVSLKNAIGSGDSFTAGIVATLLGAMQQGQERKDFPWKADLSEALRAGTAMGSANCLNIKPAHIEAADYREIYRQIRVTGV